MKWVSSHKWSKFLEHTNLKDLQKHNIKDVHKFFVFFAVLKSVVVATRITGKQQFGVQCIMALSQCECHKASLTCGSH